MSDTGTSNTKTSRTTESDTGASRKHGPDEDRRLALRLIGLGGAALLLPRDARADEPDPPEYGEDDNGITMGPKFRTTIGTSELLRKHEQSLRAMKEHWLRSVLDVHRDATTGDVVVEWGTGSAEAGAGSTKLYARSGSNPAAPSSSGGKTTFQLTWTVEIDSAGKVSVIGPGGNP